MDADVSDRTAQLSALSRQQLLDLWMKLFRRSAPLGLRREVMIPFLAYKMQEDAYGGLKPTTRLELRRIARRLKTSTSCSDSRTHRKTQPGTRMVRQWGGEAHEVLVTGTGYEHRGTSYCSLSEIARKITGTRWSGPAFFGLNRANSGGRLDA